jgi:hypothetical protein
LTFPLSSIARSEYDRKEGSRRGAVAADISGVTAETEHPEGDSGSVKLESLDIERMRLSRVSARERLERALGPDLTQLLLDALVQEGEGVPGSEPLSRDHAA